MLGETNYTAKYHPISLSFTASSTEIFLQIPMDREACNNINKNNSKKSNQLDENSYNQKSLSILVNVFKASKNNLVYQHMPMSCVLTCMWLDGVQWLLFGSVVVCHGLTVFGPPWLSHFGTTMWYWTNAAPSYSLHLTSHKWTVWKRHIKRYFICIYK